MQKQMISDIMNLVVTINYTNVEQMLGIKISDAECKNGTDKRGRQKAHMYVGFQMTNLT